MIVSEVAKRYAKALFDLGDQTKVFADLRTLNQIFATDEEVQAFFASPFLQPAQKGQILANAMADKGLSEQVLNFIQLLAEKNRLPLFSEIVEAYQVQTDEKNGVTRGSVRSASVLSPHEREQIEKTVSQATKKRVILSYSEEPNLIGGLIAEVGGFTFDDTITSHLKRIKEELKRRPQ